MTDRPLNDAVRNFILTVAYELRIDRAVRWLADRLDGRSKGE